MINMSALGQKSRNVRWPRRDTANNRINVTEKRRDWQTNGWRDTKPLLYAFRYGRGQRKIAAGNVLLGRLTSSSEASFSWSASSADAGPDAGSDVGVPLATESGERSGRAAGCPLLDRPSPAIDTTATVTRATAARLQLDLVDRSTPDVPMRPPVGRSV